MHNLPDADIYAISKSLGHSRIAVTEEYLQNFNQEKVDNNNQKLFDSMKNEKFY